MAEMNFYYEIHSKIFHSDEQSYVGYGITVTDQDTNTTITQIEDISVSKENLLVLIEQCNQLRLDPIHLCDVIEDFLLDTIYK